MRLKEVKGLKKIYDYRSRYQLIQVWEDEHGLGRILTLEVAYNILVAAEGYTAQFFEDVGFNPNDAAEQQFTIPLTQR